MSAEFFIKKEDRLPILRVQLHDNNGDSIDLTNSTVQFLYKKKPNGVSVINSATIVSAPSGIVEYAWTTGDVSSAGVYWCSWKATYSNGKSITLPSDSYITFEIFDNI